MRLITSGLCAIFLLLTPVVFASVTPSHVNQHAEQIVLEVQHLRDRLGILREVRDPGAQSHKVPLHVYAKALEVLEKISKIQTSYGLTGVGVGDIPLKPVTPSDVFELTETILQAVHEIQQVNNINPTTDQAAFVDGLTPSDVYETLWQVSFLLDDLTQKIKPNDVFRNMQRVQSDMAQLFSHLRIAEKVQTFKPPVTTRPKQVNLQGYLNLHKFSQLEKKLGMEPFRVPEYPEGKITPSDVYDTTNMMRAEAARIKTYLGITSNSSAVVEPQGKKPKDVLALLLMCNENLNILIAQARNRV